MVEAESVVDRRRLRRSLALWRGGAILTVLLLLVVLSLGGDQASGPAGFLPHIARISVDGVITDDQKMIDLLDRVGRASQVRAVILDINSPGGTTTGGEAMYDAVRRLAAKKPVVAVCGTLATSAAYLVAIATDRIFVFGNTITGSVGVIFQWAEVTDLLHTLGIKVEEVKSGPLKAVPNPFEPTDDKGRALAEEMVQDSKVWFVDLVGERRKISPQSVPGLTDGRIYSGRQALGLKLVDQIGDETAARAWLQKDRGVSSRLSILEWKPRAESGGILSWLFGSMAESLGAPAEKIAALLGRTTSGLKLDGLVSLWHPAGS